VHRHDERTEVGIGAFNVSSAGITQMASGWEIQIQINSNLEPQEKRGGEIGRRRRKKKGTVKGCSESGRGRRKK
jgi:hypothetical protein